MIRAPLMTVSALLLTGLLAGCGAGTSDNSKTAGPPAASPAGAVNGKVQGWSGGAGRVGLYLRGAPPSPLLVDAGLDASGTFKLALPGAETLAPYLEPVASSLVGGGGCQGQLTSGDPSAQGFAFSELGVIQDGAPAGNIVAQTYTPAGGAFNVSGSEWVYADKPTTLTGSVRCDSLTGQVDTTSQYTVDAALQRGWNILSVKGTLGVSGSQATADLSITSGADTPTTWTDESSSLFPLAPAGAGKNAPRPLPLPALPRR